MFSTTRSWAAAALSLMVCVAVPGLATADPTPTPTPEPTAQVPVVAVGEEPSQDYLKYSGAAMDCNTAGDRVMAALPQTSRGGYECIDPLKKTLMLYLAGGEVAVQQWTSVAQEAAAISGHTITVVPTVAEEEIPHLTPLPASATTLRLRGPLPV